MRVLVTGAGGFVGGHLVRALLAAGHEVFAAPPPQHGPPPPALSGARWLPLEMTSSDFLAAAVAEADPEWVFHLAAQSSVGESFKDPLATWEVNATGTLRLLRTLRKGTRLVFVSSSEVYGAVDEAAQPITERAPLRPVNPYGASKAAAEMAVFEAAACGRVDAVVTRSFTHTGPGQTDRFALGSFAQQLAEIRAGAKAPVLKVGNLERRRDYLDVRDVVRAYLLLAERGETGAVYNVCSGEARPLRELLDTLIELSGVEVREEIDPTLLRARDIPLLVGDSSALRALGWTPEIPLRQTLADLLASAGDGARGEEAA